MALLERGRNDKKIFLLYGSRQEETLLFKDELAELATQGQIELRVSLDFAATPIDPNTETFCRVGLVSELLDGLSFVPEQTCAVVCGPPALYGCVLEELASLGVAAHLIFATLERRMRCGIGECCHCVTGGVYICCDGPVFSLEQLRSMEGAIS
jgi:NAD(P)H-flavin reductase